MARDAALSLYYYDACGFCARVRNAIEQLGVDVELRNIQRDSEHRQDLAKATGRLTVPCLRIEDGASQVRWMHESLDIIHYLEDRAAAG